MLDLARLFLKLGFVAFGGPAAHIAMMEDEVVRRRGWISQQHFLDLIGATNLIPGPNSTEMGLHIGYERAGIAGLFVAGACFIGPAVLITGILAWLYVSYGTLPQAEPFLFGIKPAVIAVILSAVWRLGGKAVKGWRLAVLGTGVVVATLLGANEVLALLGGGLVGMVWLRFAGGGGNSAGGGGNDAGPRSTASAVAFPFAAGAVQSAESVAAGAGVVAAAGVSLWKLGLFFLKVGAVLYGSGYVLVAFLRGDLVTSLGWLTEAQLLDAIAIGQFTPGPILSTATFIGYLVQGVPGAAVATAGIFLPSFVFVLILNPLVPRLRDWPWSAAFLDAVNVAAVGLMLAVTIELGASSLTSWQGWLIAGLAALAAWRFRLNAAWLVVGGALLGWLIAP